MTKVLFGVAILFFISCQTKPTEIVKTVVIHDTVTIHDGGAAIMPTVQKLLNDYYKAGWMDGSGKVIDLHNANNLTETRLLKLRSADWRRMEAEIERKGNNFK